MMTSKQISDAVRTGKKIYFLFEAGGGWNKVDGVLTFRGADIVFIGDGYTHYCPDRYSLFTCELFADSALLEHITRRRDECVEYAKKIPSYDERIRVIKKRITDELDTI